MRSNNSNEESLALAESLRSFRETLHVETEDTKAILDYLERGLSFLCNKLEDQHKTYGARLEFDNGDMESKSKELDLKIKITHEDLKKTLKEFIDQNERNHRSMLSSINETCNKISEQSLAKSHKFEDQVMQIENRITQAKHEEEEDLMQLFHKIEAIGFNMNNKIEDLTKLMKDGFASVQEGLASINNSMCSKAGR